MKKLFPVFALALTLSPFIVLADVGESSSSTFRGVITAIETERDSITVENDDKQVKMFAVDHARKESLEVGQTITVGYIEDYQWPLKTTSISGGSEK